MAILADCPNDPLAREVLAAFLIRGLGIDVSNPPSTPQFSDVPSTNSFYSIIQTAAARGLMTGCGNGMFCPQGSITRGDAAPPLVQAMILGNPPP